MCIRCLMDGSYVCVCVCVCVCVHACNECNGTHVYILYVCMQMCVDVQCME